MSQANDISSYRQFWPHYLREHAKPLTRKLHFMGTGLAITALIAAAYLANGWLLTAAMVLGYGPAWDAHF
ncbi:MAG: Mpo1-like protein, partial [Alphaproteobacteria bacterium]